MNKIILLILFTLSTATISAADPESKSERNAISRKKASHIVSMYIKSEMTDFEKVLILHEYISDRVNYGKFNNKTDAYTALIHNQSDCVGFARGLNELFNAAGLKSFVVVRKKGHLWLKVMLHGKYYNIDPTWTAVKSKWPPYGWFLLSDAQNIDSDKGIDHILDSGEKYESADEEFIFDSRDIVNKKLIRREDRIRLFGTLKLPIGQSAPEGGIIGDINGNRFCIPEGKNSVFFITHLNRDSKSPYICLRINHDPNTNFIKQSYYSKDSTIAEIHNAETIDLNSDDITGLSLQIKAKSKFISGAFTLPENIPAPAKGCYVSIELCSTADKERIKYTDRVFIPVGKNSAEFRIDINDKDSNLNYYLYYYSSNIADMGFSKSAYLTKNGMSSVSKEKLMFKISDIKNAVILKPVK